MARTPKLPKGPGSGAKTAPPAFLAANKNTQIKPGEVKNPYGRKGKDGTGGASLKNEFKSFLNRMSQDERDAIWAGLYMKAMTGDVAATKMLIELNGEVVSEQKIEATAGASIIINIPPTEAE